MTILLGIFSWPYWFLPFFIDLFYWLVHLADDSNANDKEDDEYADDGEKKSVVFSIWKILKISRHLASVCTGHWEVFDFQDLGNGFRRNPQPHSMSCTGRHPFQFLS